MTSTRRRLGSLIGLCLALAAPVAWAAETAEKLLAKIEAIEIPPAESRKPGDATRVRKATDSRNALILDLYKAHPDTPELARLMPERWRSRPSTTGAILTTKAEVDEILRKGGDEKLMAEAAHYRVLLLLRRGAGARHEEVLKAIDDFVRRSPGDERAAALLLQLAEATPDKAYRAALHKRIEADFPGTSEAKKVGEAGSSVASESPDERVGKPFALEFVDAVRGTRVSMAGLKGKVVVVDFWATWCGPCVAEMPKMKELYAKYRGQGVEFIGVSLDQSEAEGGLEKLREFVAGNGIPWPQYYQGNYWQSEFSSSWKVHSIPCVFLIDAEGNLASMKARGQLDRLIPEYLEKARAKKAGGKR